METSKQTTYWLRPCVCGSATERTWPGAYSGASKAMTGSARIQNLLDHAAVAASTEERQELSDCRRRKVNGALFTGKAWKQDQATAASPDQLFLSHEQNGMFQPLFSLSRACQVSTDGSDCSSRSPRHSHAAFRSAQLETVVKFSGQYYGPGWVFLEGLG
ncbi:hypothetical protein GWK47_018962 [Chionoecetes opilio]|uniref:Uncharacterized protein n=1 Tax=Chionoecetes opilio TaxID=41210 RepID=A0A8J5BXM7_CHIOP|nr:hypothetical protein GWK47_018962 [Chionoecetes opilio]